MEGSTNHAIVSWILFGHLDTINDCVRMTAEYAMKRYYINDGVRARQKKLLLKSSVK